MSSNESSAQAVPQFSPVILSGGRGGRFWSLFRKSRPRQFLTLDDSGLSLIPFTVRRFATILGTQIEDILIVTGVDHRMHVLEHLSDLPTANLLVEPVARNTAAAVLYTFLKIAQMDERSRMRYSLPITGSISRRYLPKRWAVPRRWRRRGTRW